MNATLRALRHVGWLLPALALPACVDLFHDTDSLLTACDLDATACNDGGPQGDGGTEPPAPQGLCTDDPTAAYARAERVCAWLGACNGAFGTQQAGNCLFDARRAYHCGADPNQAPRGARADFWACAAAAVATEAQSCDAMWRCSLPGGQRQCETNDNTQSFTRCSDAEHAPFVSCEPDGAESALTYVENCAAAGGRCVENGQRGCSADLENLSATCTNGSECRDDVLVRCSSSRSVAGELDCTLSGAGRCVAGNAAVASDCAPVASDDAAPCEGTTPVVCDGEQRASRCVEGTLEVADCAALGLQCAALDSHSLASDACRNTGSAMCTPGCEGQAVRSCFRGQKTLLPCAAPLGACQEQKRMVNNVGQVTAFACAAPDAP